MDIVEAITRISQNTGRCRDSEESRLQRSWRFLIVGATRIEATVAIARGGAGSLYDDPEACIRFDMSEFTEKQSIARLIGGNGGLVCAWFTGELTGSIARRPRQVILFDKIEMAHPDFLRMMTAIMSGESIFDGGNEVGRNVSFEDSTILMTTEASIPLDGIFPDEFLGLLDDVIDYRHASLLRPPA